MTTKDGLPMNISLTAAAVVGLTTAASVMTGTTQSKAETAKLLAGDYLAEQFDKLVDPFEICIVTYALHVANHKGKTSAFLKMRSIKRESEFVYWSPDVVPPNPTEIVNTVPIQHPKPLALPYESKAIEATSYALMVYLMNNWYAESVPIMNWLQTRRSSHSGFDSVRDSVIATQALVAFATRNTNRDLYNMLVHVDSTANTDWKKEVSLRKGSFLRYQQEKVPDVWGAIKAYALGTGIALIQMTTEVNVEYPYQMRQPEVKAFSLEMDILTFSGRNSSIMEMTVCATWLATHIAPTSGTVLIEIDIPSGFFIRKFIQRKYQRVERIHIMRARFTKHKVVWYIDFIDTTRTCWYVKAERWFPIANATIQHKMRIYDTSEPGLHNTTLYTTFGLYHNHICQVCGSFQCPYCPYYNAAPEGIYTGLTTFAFVLLVVLNVICFAL